jgi:hypothetical protein
VAWIAYGGVPPWSDSQTNAPPYADLRAYAFLVYRHDAEGRIGVTGQIWNVGNSSAGHDFDVAIGVTVVIAGVTRSQEEIFRLDGSLSAGSTVETPESSAPLVYREDDPGAVYQLEMLVDLNFEVSELSRGNDHLGPFPYWFNRMPVTRTEPFKIGDIAAELRSQ